MVRNISTGLHRARAAFGSIAKSDLDRALDALACVILAAVTLVVWVTFRDYGIAWDEQGESVYGTLLLKFYASGFRDAAAYEFVNLRYYGGGFELPAAVLSRLLPFGEYETRHLLSALVGVLGLAITWRIARRVGGAGAGVLALAMLALNPTWYGHMFINARDLPFACGMIGCVLLTLRALGELPAIGWRTAAMFGAALGWTISVRIGGVLAVALFLAPIGVWLIGRARAAGWNGLWADARRIAGAALIAFTAAYAVMAVFWPWAVQSPLNPLHALQMFSQFPFDAPVLFRGELIRASQLPAAYLPVLLALKQPVIVLLGLAGALLVALIHRRQRSLELAQLRLFTVALAAGIPIAYCVLTQPVDYNGMRHFLFVVPPLTVIAALGAHGISISMRAAWIRAALGVAIAAALLVQIRPLVELHPNQYVYFNSLVGGPRGAQGRFELDYWGTSLAEATDRLAGELERRDVVPRTGQPPFKVYVCGNVWSAAALFPRWLTPVERIEAADFQIALNEYFCKHPPYARRMFEVTRAGAQLSYVDDLRPAAAHPELIGAQDPQLHRRRAPVSIVR